jgi:uncharacterized membrane protein (UPF0182 family)
MTNPPQQLPTYKKVMAILLFMAAIVFNYIAIKQLRTLSSESGIGEYVLLLLFLAAGFGSLLLSQRLRVVRPDTTEVE